MNKLQKRLISAAATITLLANAVSPGLAATTLEISGNGSDSTNTTTVGATQTTAVSQTNTANVTNNINADANTGNNSASDNTGGDVSIDTGNADVDVDVTNDLNHNSADVDRCGGCGFGDVTATVTGNGSHSENEVELGLDHTTLLDQSNYAYVTNNVDADAKTGHNDADDNTTGDVNIDTGNATTDVTVANTLNTNSARIGGDGNGGSVLAEISGNGTHSDNDVVLGLASVTWVDQANSAYVSNYVDADAKTGKNDANDNTDGDVSIDTGDASTTVDIANVANSNSALVLGGEGEGGGVSVRILGNGSHSENEIELDLAALTTLFQNNNANIYNYVDADAKTGKNDANDNTGGEATIDTGDADVDVIIDNWANFNFADVECDCLFDGLLAKIAGNGTDSDSTIKAALADDLFVDQDNCGSKYEWWWWDEHCSIDTSVYADGQTGKNDTNDNTEGTFDPSDPSVDTGDADVNIDANTSGNVNVYGDSEWELPFPHDSSVNLNISFNLEDLLGWLLSHDA